MALLPFFKKNAQCLLIGGMALAGSNSSHAQTDDQTTPQHDKRATYSFGLGRENSNSAYNRGSYVVLGAQLNSLGDYSRLRAEYVYYNEHPSAENFGGNPPERTSPSTRFRMMAGVGTDGAHKVDINMYAGLEAFGNTKAGRPAIPNTFVRTQADIALWPRKNKINIDASIYAEYMMYSKDFNWQHYRRADAFTTGIRFNLQIRP